MKIKKSSITFVIVIVSLILLWIVFPNKLFMINVHSHYLLFGFGTIALLVFCVLIAWILINYILKYRKS